jgi:PAS domain S-box-containing protein
MRSFRFNLRRATKVIVPFLVALLLLGGIGIMSYRSTLTMIEEGERIVHQDRVLKKIETVMMNVARDVATQRGFLISGDEDELRGHPESLAETEQALRTLRHLLGGHAAQQLRMDALDQLLSERARLWENQTERRRSGNLQGLQQDLQLGEGERLLQQTLQYLREMAEEERAELRQHQAQVASSAQMTQIAIIAGGSLAFLLVAAAIAQLLKEMSLLQKAQETFKELLESAPDAMAIVNQQGEITRVNAETERIFGYHRGELVGLPFQLLVPETNPAHSLQQQKSKDRIERMARRKDGSEFPVEISLSPLRSEKGPLISSAIRDVSQRKRAEQALKENEELMRFALEADKMGHWDWNTHTGAMTRSLRHDLTFGYETLQADWSYERFMEHVLPEDREEVDTIVREGTNSKSGFDFKCRILRCDGALRWIRICGRYLSSEDKAPERIAGVIRDITEEKQVEDLMRHKEQFRAAILDAIPAEIAVLDAQGTIVAVNEPWLRFGQENQGLDGATGVGANYLEVSRKAALAGDSHAAETANGLDAILAGELREFQLEYPCDSPIERRWFMLHAVAAPEIGGAIVTHSNISDLKKAEQDLRANEELLRTMIAAIPDTVQVKDSEGRWLLANEAALRHFKIEGLDWFGKTDAEISKLAPEDTAANFELCQRSDERAWRTTGLLRDLDRIPQPDGKTRFYDVIKVPLRHPDGSPKQLVVIGRDITDEQNAKESLRDFNNRLEARVEDRTAKLQTAMAVLRKEITERLRLEEEILGISERQQMRIGQDLHDDLGQQLVGAAMLAELLSKELNAESHPRGQSAAQLASFIAESIATTRNLAKSFYPVELERGGLIVALQDLANRTEALAHISCKLHSDASFTVPKSAEIHLYRIVQESISNAIKHGHAPNVDIECVSTDDSRIITVTDNGSGFTPPKEGEWGGMGLHLFAYRARLIGAEIHVRQGEEGGCQVSCVMPAHERSRPLKEFLVNS